MKNLLTFEEKKMKRFYQTHLAAVCFAVVFVLGFSGTAMSFGHYTPGALGINGASLPPQGFHYTMYNMFYSADKMNDDKGDALPIGFDVDVFAIANQFTFISDSKLFGADLGFDFIIPLVYTDISIDAMGVDEDHFAIGDICLEPFLLAWHTPRWDVTFALGFYAPTADSNEPSSAGKGYWSFMETLGATYYFDEARTITFSVLTRWLQNGEDADTHITPGADVVAEYGLSKTLPIDKTSIFTAGLAGYSYDQLSDDSGAGASDDRFIGNAIGPEIRYMVFKPFPIQISARYLFEYGVENSTEGDNACLTLIGSF